MTTVFPTLDSARRARLRTVFAYCERGLDPDFWAEPLNAVVLYLCTRAVVLDGRAATAPA